MKIILFVSIGIFVLYTCIYHTYSSIYCDIVFSQGLPPFFSYVRTSLYRKQLTSDKLYQSLER